MALFLSSKDEEGKESEDIFTYPDPMKKVPIIETKKVAADVESPDIIKEDNLFPGEASPMEAINMEGEECVGCAADLSSLDSDSEKIKMDASFSGICEEVNDTLSVCSDTTVTSDSISTTSRCRTLALPPTWLVERTVVMVSAWWSPWSGAAICISQTRGESSNTLYHL